jgi:hypothetical protein
LKSREYSNRNRDITKHDILDSQRNSVGPQELVEWTGDTSFEISQGEVPKTSHQDSRYHEFRNADGVKALKGQLARALEFRRIGVRESVKQVA